MEEFCIYVKNEQEHYEVTIKECGKTKLFESKASAHDYAKSVGLKHYVVKHPN